MLDQWNLDTAVEVMCAISSPSLNKCPTSFLLLLPSPFYSFHIRKRRKVALKDEILAMYALASL